MGKLKNNTLFNTIHLEHLVFLCFIIGLYIVLRYNPHRSR